jgi:hypothetical protein
MQSNIDAAKGLGMQGICYSTFEQFEIDFKHLPGRIG